MGFMPDAVKNAVEDAVAKVQGEVGRFLILKERIRTLPAGLTREDLLAQQDRLEKSAMALIAKGQSLKADLEVFNPFDLKQVAALGPKVRLATETAKEGAALVEAIAAHKARVISAVGSSADLGPSPTSPTPRRGELWKKAAIAAVFLVPLGFLAAPGLAYYLKRRK